MTAETISIEIFRDAQQKSIQIDAVEAAIDEIREIVPTLTIAKTKRLLKVGKPENDFIVAQDVRWPVLEADLNILATNRRLLANKPTGVHELDGPTILGNAVTAGLARVALVDVSKGYPVHTTMHEVGHLFGLKKEGSGCDGSGHCREEGCLMHSHQLSAAVDRIVEKRGVASWLEKRGFRDAKYETRTMLKAHSFCSECKEQLARRAFYLLRAKNDSTIPGAWYS